MRFDSSDVYQGRWEIQERFRPVENSVGIIPNSHYLKATLRSRGFRIERDDNASVSGIPRMAESSARLGGLSDKLHYFW
jgi:hypothetical protein